MTTNTRTSESEESATRSQKDADQGAIGRVTNRRSAAERIADSHALETRPRVTERTLHPLRPAPRRKARHAHGDASRLGEPAPSSAPRGRSARTVVAPTAIPDHSGDLLGLPDFGAVRRAWDWLAERAREARDIDARLAARREEDAVTARSNGALSRLV